MTLLGAHNWQTMGDARALASVLTLLLGALLLACQDRTPEPSSTVDLLAPPGLQPVTVTAEVGADPEVAEVAEATWDFEDTSPEGWQVLSDWEIFTRHGKAAGGVTQDVAHGGKSAFCIEAGDGGADADAQVHLEVEASTRYRLEGYVRTVNLEASSARLYGTFYLGEFSYVRDDNRDANDPVRWHPSLPKLEGTTEGWERITYDFRTSPRTSMLRLAASLGSWGVARGRVCFDDVRLTELSETDRDRVAPAEVDAVRQIAVGSDVRRALGATVPSAHRYELTVPAGARLHVGLGIEADGQASVPYAVLFEVAVIGDRRSDTILSRRVLAGDPLAGNRWVDADVSLAAYAGERVQLVFRTIAPAPSRPGPAPMRGAWANPTVYVAPADADREREPNVFLITVDTLRPDHLGCYGYARDTSPAIDELAAEGVLFENAFTTVPRTTPALASLMTGLYPRAHGLLTLVDSLPEEQTTLAELLKARGYTTGAIVTHNVARPSGLQQGFDTYDDHIRIGVNDPRSRAEALAAEAAAWVVARAGMKVFLWLHVWDPHFRYIPPAPFERTFDPEFDEVFDLYDRLDRGAVTLGQVYFENDLPPRQLAHAVALYDGEIRYADTVLGLFLEQLKALGLYDRALIVFTSDHGESLGEHGYTFEHGEYLYDGTLRIPLIVKYPFERTKGLRIKGKAMILDIMPTILSVVGARDLPPSAGKDLTLFLDGASEPHEVCYAETDRRFFRENARRYVDGIAGNWKSIRRGDRKLIEIPTPAGSLYELYDLETDPGETRNLYQAGNPEADALAGELKIWLAGFEQPGQKPRTEEAALDDSTKERLRALGYLNE